MIYKNFKFGGQAIPYTALEGQTSRWYADISFKINSSTSTQDSNSWHGVNISPTYARERLIFIKWEVFAVDRAVRKTAINTITDTFKVSDYPSYENEYKKLEFEDDLWNEFFIYAKVEKMPEYDHERGSIIVNWNCGLIAKDIYIRSKESNTVIWHLWQLGGLVLDTELPTAMNYALWKITCNNLWNFPSLAIISITAIDDEIVNPKILNITTGKFYKLNYTIPQWDTVIFDSENLTVKNGDVSLARYREPWSSWILLSSGVNEIVGTYDNFDYDTYETGNEVKIEFYNTNI